MRKNHPLLYIVYIMTLNQLNACEYFGKWVGVDTLRQVAAETSSANLSDKTDETDRTYRTDTPDKTDRNSVHVNTLLAGWVVTL